MQLSEPENLSSELHVSYEFEMKLEAKNWRHTFTGELLTPFPFALFSEYIFFFCIFPNVFTWLFLRHKVFASLFCDVPFEINNTRTELLGCLFISSLSLFAQILICAKIFFILRINISACE